MRNQRRGLNLALVGALAALIGFVATVQVRTQQEVVRTLAGQDPTTLAFLIDNLHESNDALAGEAASLAARRDALQSGGGAEAAAQIAQDLSDLQVSAGAIAVHGPGVVITIDAPLNELDLEDAANQLRASGAEALSINDRRVVLGSVYRSSGPSSAPVVTIDGTPESGPWTVVAIGNPSRLGATADAMARSLRSDSRVRNADYRAVTDVTIRSTVATRRFVYGSP